MADLPMKKDEELRVRRSVRSTTLRKLLPKPLCKDPPDIVHIKLLPQPLLDKEDSVSDNQEHDSSDNGLAEELPNISCEEPIKNITEVEKSVENEDEHIETIAEVEIPLENRDGQIESITEIETPLENRDGQIESISEIKTPLENAGGQIENIAEVETPVENGDINLENDIGINDNESEEEETTVTGETVLEEDSENSADLANKKSEAKTPKPPLIRKNISRSTPRRNSHVRALCFNTPHKPMLSRRANTSPKMPKIQLSPRSSKLDLVKRSSLFKSPPSPKSARELSRLTEEDEGDESEDDNLQEVVNNSPLSKVPIATRIPTPKLSSAWKEVNDVTITEKHVKKTGKPIKSTTPVKVIEKPASRTQKPQWDNKIRSFVCGDFVDPVPPPKKQLKKKPKEKYPALKKEVKSKTNNSSLRRSTRLSSESPLKEPLKNKVKSRMKTSSQKQKIKPISRPSQSKINKTSNKSSSKPILKINEKLTSCEAVRSSSDDTSSSSCVDVSKSVTTNLNKGVTGPSPSKSLETNILNPDSHINQSETISSKEVVNKSNSNITSNILLEDLVLSSNSCFPLTVEDSAKEPLAADLKDNGHRKVMNDPTDQFKPDHSNKKSFSPKFALPLIPVQETPLKDIQAVFPATPVLNTPFLKTIMTETSVLEEDLLLTPSLPPTPQVVSPHHLGRTPSKPVVAVGSVAVMAQQSCSPVKKVKASNVGAQIKVSSTPRTTKVKESNQKAISDTSSDSIEDCPDKHIVPLSQNRSSNTSKYNLTTSSESSDEEVANRFFSCSIGNQTTFKPTIKTRIIQGPVHTKPRNYFNSNKIYTTSDSSEEDNNDKNVNKAQSDQINQESNQNVAKLRIMLLEEEKNRINSSLKTLGFNKKQMINRKLKSKSQNKINEKNEYASPRSNSYIDKPKIPVQLNKSSIKANTSSPKEKRSENNRNIIITPEKVREQLENDLLKKERQNIFGEDLQLSSDSESDLEVFEKKNQINKQKSKKTISKKSLKRQEVLVSEESSNEVVYKSNAIGNSSKTVRFETITKIGILDESNSVRKSLEAAVDAKAFDTLKNNITENSDKTINVERINETVNAVTAGNNSELCSNEESINTKNIDCAHFQSKNVGKNALSDKRCYNKGKSQISLKGNTSGMNQNSNSCRVSYSKNSEGSSTTNQDTVVTLDQNDYVSGSRLPTPPPPYFQNSVPQCDNSSAVEDHEVSKYVNDIDKSEAHLSVFSNDSIRKNTKPVSLNVPEFDPDFQAQFESENGMIKLTYSKTIVHFEMANNKTHQDVYKKNICQESLKTVSQKPSKGVDGKRRVKLIPVEDGKYKNLRVDYDIIDGQIISKREERQKSNDAEVLDFTCSTIDADSIPDSTTKNQNFSVNRLHFRESVLSLQGGRGKNENKDGGTKTTSNCEETENLSQFSGRTSQTKSQTTDNETIPLFVKPLTKRSETIEQKLKTTKTSEVIIRPKEAVLKKKNPNEHVKQIGKTAEYEDKYSKTQLDKRKEVELRDRRRERDTSERFVRKDQSRRYSSRREDDRRRYSERRHQRSPERYYRSYLDRRRDSRKYCARTPPYEDYDRDTRCSVRRRETKRLSKPSSQWKDVDYVKEQENKKDSVEEPSKLFDPRAEHQQLTSYSDVEKNSSSDEADSLMDFAVLTKSKRKRLSDSSHSSPGKESLVRSGQSSKRKASSSGEETLETIQANKKLKMEEKDMRTAKSVLKHKMADMLNVLHPDTSNEAS